jgi:hypothetical protein
MGSGQLNMNRALQQFKNGEFNGAPYSNELPTPKVPTDINKLKIGWD